MTILDDIAEHLTTNTTFTVGGTTGDLTLGQMLDTQPDTVISIYVQPGLGNAYAFSTGTFADIVYDRPGIQLLSRSTSPNTAEHRINLAYQQLDGLTDTTINGVVYHEITAVQAPFQLGRDDNQRALWSCNFDVKKARGRGFDQGFDQGFG